MNTRILSLGFLAAYSVIGSVAAQQVQPSQSRVIVAPVAESQQQAGRAARQAPVRSTESVAAAAPADTAVDSVAEDLQRIVVLCATDPESDEFRTAWVQYVRTHRVTADQLDPLIEDVIRRAEAYRAERSSNPRTNRMVTVLTSTSKKMHDVAMPMIRNMR